MYDISHQPEAMQARYKFLPPAITELFDYGTVESVVESTAKEFGLNEEQKAALLMEIELILFFFMTRNGLVERLKESLEVEQIRATQIAAKVESDLFVIVDGILDVAEAEFNKEEIEAPQETPTIPEPSEDISAITPPPITPAKPLNAMPENANLNQAHSYGAFRGEGSDSNEDEPVHRSSQDDIIRQ